MHVENSLAGRTQWKEDGIKIGESGTLSLSVGNEESKKFVLGVSGKKISKSSSGKQKF